MALYACAVASLLMLAGTAMRSCWMLHTRDGLCSGAADEEKTVEA